MKDSVGYSDRFYFSLGLYLIVYVEDCIPDTAVGQVDIFSCDNQYSLPTVVFHL